MNVAKRKVSEPKKKATNTKVIAHSTKAKALNAKDKILATKLKVRLTKVENLKNAKAPNMILKSPSTKAKTLATKTKAHLTQLEALTMKSNLPNAKPKALNTNRKTLVRKTKVHLTKVEAQNIKAKAHNMKAKGSILKGKTLATKTKACLTKVEGRPTKAKALVTNVKVSKQQKSDEKLLINVVGHLQNNKGCSFPEIKKYLVSKHKMDDASRITLALRNAVDRGSLSKVSGKYKVTEKGKRRKQSGSESGSGCKETSELKTSTRKSTISNSYSLKQCPRDMNVGYTAGDGYGGRLAAYENNKQFQRFLKLLIEEEIKKH